MSTFDCDDCERALQPYLDRYLSEEDMAKVSVHLAGCKWCDDRYKLETELRRLVRQTATEPMDAALKLKLSELRLEL
jgi:anti-sigma factor (TIGR02949 family)